MEDTHDLDNMNVQDCNGSECPASKNPKPKIAALLEYVEVFVVAIALVILLFSFALRVCSVSGRSMENTLYEGETLIISDLFYEPSRGDIIVFHQTGEGYNEPIVKRVIATEGDTIRITRDAIFVNNEILLEDSYVHLDNPFYKYVTEPPSAIVEDEEIEISYVWQGGIKIGYEFKIPDGELFIMGDHRDDSADSRSIGTVREDAILGKVILRLFPFSKFGTVN
jgi:signal peptidase I